MPEILARLPEPKRITVKPVREVQLVEQEPELQQELLEPETTGDPSPEILAEPPLPLPYPTPKAVPGLVCRVLPVAAKPEPSAAPTEVPEESVAPRLPKDYVQKLQLDPRNKPPKYPPLARRLGTEGRVVIAVTLTPGGGAASVRVVSSAGTSPAHQQMDRAALRALRRWHYQRILQGVQAVQLVIHVPVEFRLVDTRG